MANSVYSINKGINKSIEFKGLKAQYIWYLGGGLVGLMIGFVLMYVAGVNAYLCVVLVLIAGTGLFIKVYKMSNAYGEHGLMKKIAKRNIPKLISSTNRNLFILHRKKIE